LNQTFIFLQSIQLLCAIKSNLQISPILLLYFSLLIGLDSCLVETTIPVETNLLVNGLVHLSSVVIKFLTPMSGIVDIFNKTIRFTYYFICFNFRL